MAEPRTRQIQDLLDLIGQMNMEEIIAAHPRALLASDAITSLLMAAVPSHEHSIALAIALGAILAACEDEMCEADKDGFVSGQDRLDIFLAYFKTAFGDGCRINAESKAHAAIDKHGETKGTH